MALYKHGNRLTQSQDAAFDAMHAPGMDAPYLGIYRCTSCGDEIAIAGGTHFRPRTIGNTILATVRSGGNYWFIQCSSVSCEATVNRTGERRPHTREEGDESVYINSAAPE